MSNRLEELHYQYKRYYLKKGLKVLGVLSILIVLTLAGYFLLEKREEAPVQKSFVPQENTSSKAQTNKPSAPSYVLSVSNDALEQSAKRIEEKTVVAKKVKAASPKKQTQVYSKLAPAREKKFENYFSKPNEEKSLDDWIEKYNQKKSYTMAIAIAKQFYFNNDFKQSSVWSKRANQLDRNKEEAWIYYAKSVHALGDETKAKKILNIYLQYKDSTKAELLLVEWSQ